jgi:hypothetical protein
MVKAEREVSGSAGQVLPAGWVPRLYEPGDEEGGLDVLRAAFAGWPKIQISVPPLEHLRWKISSPFGGARYTLAAELDGRIVGWHSYIFQQVVVEGCLLRGRQGTDSSVHPDYQRSRIKTEMRHLTMDNPRRDHQFTLGLASGHPAMKRIQQRWGRRARRYLANSIESLTLRGGNALDQARTLLARWRAAPQPPESVSIHQIASFDERVDSLWEAASPQFQVIVERRQHYLNWRYADPRAGNFRIMVAEEHGAIAGYIVTSSSRVRGFIADILVMPGRLDVVDMLVRHAVDNLQRPEIRDIECWTPRHHPYRRVLRARGFVHKRRTVPLACRVSQGANARMTCGDDPNAAVHITMGDTDIV